MEIIPHNVVRIPAAVCCKTNAWERDYPPAKATLEWLKKSKVSISEWLSQKSLIKILL